MSSEPPHAPHGEVDRSPKANGGGGSTLQRARRLRKQMSLPEVLLWRCLRRRALTLKFRKQHPLPPYILDFYCPAARLAVEIDGEIHGRGDQPERDSAKDAFLRGKGLRVLRIPAADVLADPEAIAEAIVASVAVPLHRPAGGPPPHAAHGEVLSGAD